MTRKPIMEVLSVFIVVYFFTAVVAAQSGGGGIVIQFLDPQCSNKTIKGVKVIVRGKKFVKKTSTGSDGQITLGGLAPGKYQVFADKYGFKKLNVTNIDVSGGDVFQHAYQMERGYASDDANQFTRGYDPCKHADKPKKFMHVP